MLDSNSDDEVFLPGHLPVPTLDVMLEPGRITVTTHTDSQGGKFYSTS